MKSEHRHELKTNELAEWLANLPQWWRENAKTIILVAAVVVVVAGVYFYRGYQKNVVAVRKQTKLTRLILTLPQNKMQILRSQAEGYDSSYMLFQPADGLAAAAQNANNDQMAALALIKRAQALRMELHYRLETPNKQAIADSLDKVQASYIEAFSKASDNPSLMAAAKFGIGLCEEERGEFAKAEDIYLSITKNVLFEGTAAIAAAKQRLETIDNYKQKIVFKPAPEPVEPQLPDRAGGG